MSNYFNYGDPDKEFEEIQKLIDRHLDADYFNISFRYQLKTLPDEIRGMKDLEELLINYCYRFQAFPESVQELKKLRQLQLSNGRNANLPENLSLFQQIERLNLSYHHYKAKSNWNELAALKQLKSLDLSGSLYKMKSIPKEVFELKELEFLYLSDNNLKTLPKELSKLSKLRILDIGHNSFTHFPEILLELPQLETLVINAQAIDSLPLELLDMPALQKLQVSGKDNRRFPNVSLMEKLVSQIQKRDLSLEYAAFILSILRDPKQMETLDEAELIDLLNSDIESLVVQALPLLETKLRKRKPQLLKAGDRLVIKGKLGGKKSSLKNRIKSLEIETGVKLNKSTTHLVLGRLPKLDWAKIQKFEGLEILTEAMLMEQLNQLEMPYLLEAEAEGGIDQQLEHLRSLFQSGQDDNIMLAFEILHGGGFPEDLMTDLFLLYKETNNPKIRREALHFINQYGPSEFGLAVKRRLSIFGRWVTEATICKNLLYYCEAGNLDRKRVVNYLHKRIKKGASFALLHLPLEDKIDFFEANLREEKLNLSRLDLTQLPKDLPKMGRIRELDLSANYFSSLPELIFTDLKDLEVLGLQTMFYLGHFPERLLRIPSLKKVIISTKYRNMPSEKELRKAGLEVVYVNPYKEGHY
jgi:Leucine-rich repeat (LRR) protein